MIGSIELLQVLIGVLQLHGRLFDAVGRLDFGTLGYVVVALFLIAWGVSVALWRYGRIEARYGPAFVHAHEHSHDGGQTHVHEHVHRAGAGLLAPTQGRSGCTPAVEGGGRLSAR